MTQGPEMRNMLVAMVLSALVLMGWQYFVAAPQQAAAKREAEAAQAANPKTADAEPIALVPDSSGSAPAAVKAPLARSEALAQSGRIRIESPELSGSISLKGLRLDDLTLSQYRQTPDERSDTVVLLNPAGSEGAYFAEFGWLAGGEGKLAVPDSNTLWQAGSAVLKAGSSVLATWDNAQGLRFERRISLDEHYMFTVEEKVVNTSGGEVTLYPYGLISRRYADEGEHFFILHEGPLGVVNNALEELNYKDLREEGKISYAGKTDWIGITDKYWLAALVPDKQVTGNATMQYREAEGGGSYQTDFTGSAQKLAAGGTLSLTHRVFAGAKRVKLLDAYAQQDSIMLFDRAVDFGWFYFLTKPIFYALSFFNHALGNFGLAILALTIVIKLLLFPLANKSYKSMSQMKLLMPKMQQIKERFKDDKMAMNQEIMKLYQAEKVNPASGCLPMLVQIPIFFSLYKVLFVTIEMRHADFYGWVHDLSAPDPTNLFTLFGLVPWDAPQFLHLGLWPLIMCATMVIQMRLNPKPADPAQAMVMQWMPFMFLFLFASFPAGLVIYWAWNNSLSIIQQYVIMRRHGVK